MGTILDRILAARREEVSRRKRMVPLAVLRMTVEKKPLAVRDFAAALACDSINVIAEMKKVSPSRGVIREDYRPAELAPALERAGAAAFSVLTEEQFFSGSLADLKSVRAAAGRPILRKDFIVDPWQVWETRAAGADAFLLIVAALDAASLAELVSLGRELGMESLVEVHSPEELGRALDADARIVGVNNRDLRTFAVRTETSFELIERVPDDCFAVSESGLSTRAELDALRCAGFDAFLVGEHLMGQADPAEALAALLTPASKPEAQRRMSCE